MSVRAAWALALCVLAAGCARPEEPPCEPLALDVAQAQAAVGEPIEMTVIVANCGAEPELHSFGCLHPAPYVVVSGHSYRVSYGAATDRVPDCVLSSYAEHEELSPGERASWMVNWNGTVSGGCADGCDAPVPAPGQHVLRVEWADHTVERSVEFR